MSRPPPRLPFAGLSAPVRQINMLSKRNLSDKQTVTVALHSETKKAAVDAAAGEDTGGVQFTLFGTRTMS